MARITSSRGSKLQKQRYRQKSLFRCLLIFGLVAIILVMAFLLHQTDRAMFRHTIMNKNKSGSISATTSSNSGSNMKKSVLLQLQQQQQQQNSAGNIRSVKSGGRGDGDENDSKEKKEEGTRRVELDLDNLTGGNTFGTITIETIEGWAPLGVQRFWELIDSEFYINCQMFRVLPNFIAQFGIGATPSIHSQWKQSPIQDDPVLHSNLKHTVTFAMSGKNTRTTQIFINLKDNVYLDKQGFAPFGRVVAGHEYLSLINAQYKELPNQGKIVNEGNAYLDREYPGLTYISAIRPVEDDTKKGGDDDGDGDDKKKGEEEGDDKEDGDDEEDGDKGDGDDKEEGEEDTEGEEEGGEDADGDGDGDDGKEDDKGKEETEGDDEKSEE